MLKMSQSLTIIPMGPTIYNKSTQNNKTMQTRPKDYN